MTPQEYCQDKAGGAGSSFYYSSLFLDPTAREAITALYAFGEELRDIARGPGDPQMAGIRLAWWREEIANTFANRPTHPVSKMLHKAIHAYSLPKQGFVDIIAGVEQDLARAQYSTFDELRGYCRQVASATVLLSVHVLGGTTPGSEQLLRELGAALRLTEILRDAGEDARRDRVYLPVKDLNRFSVNMHDVLQARSTDNFRALMEFEVARVYALFEKTLQSLPQPDRWRQVFHLIMARIYLALLQEMRADGYGVLRHKIALTPLRKGWIAWRTWRREKRLYKKYRRKAERNPAG